MAAWHHNINSIQYFPVLKSLEKNRYTWTRYSFSFGFWNSQYMNISIVVHLYSGSIHYSVVQLPAIKYNYNYAFPSPVKYFFFLFDSTVIQVCSFSARSCTVHKCKCHDIHINCTSLSLLNFPADIEPAYTKL